MLAILDRRCKSKDTHALRETVEFCTAAISGREVQKLEITIVLWVDVKMVGERFEMAVEIPQYLYYIRGFEDISMRKSVSADCEGQDAEYVGCID